MSIGTLGSFRRGVCLSPIFLIFDCVLRTSAAMLAPRPSAFNEWRRAKVNADFPRVNAVLAAAVSVSRQAEKERRSTVPAPSHPTGTPA